MTTLFVDYAWQHPNPGAIVADGYAGVIRYLSTDPTKNLSASERDELHAAGLGILLVWETAAQRALDGSVAGSADAALAEAQADALGYPAGCPIFYAVDFNATPDQIAAYFAGIAKTAKRPIGLYGSGTVVDNLVRLGARYGWQTSAWSGPYISPNAYVYQRLSATRPVIAGSDIHSYDEDVILGNIPCWNPDTVPVVYHPPTTNPVGDPPGTVKYPAFPLAANQYFGWQNGGPNSISGYYSHRADLQRWQQRMADRGWTITDDGYYGTQTESVTKAFQKQKGLTVDGKIGPETWKMAWTAPLTSN